MASDRAIRGLNNIRKTAASARVLDLLTVGLNHGEEEEYKARPFFKNTILNNAIIIKHRLRADEMMLFQPKRFVATKIIMPIDRTDLRIGGRYIFVGQQHYDLLMRDCFGDDVGVGSPDRRILDALDELPSLDPFILREHLARRQIRPAACYFDVSETDLERMSNFMQADIAPLVRMCFGAEGEFTAETKLLVSKLLANSLDKDLEPLRATLRLDEHQYAEGVFCWKGFLYYKSLVTELFPDALEVAREIQGTRPIGKISPEEIDQIRQTKSRLARDIVTVCQEIHRALNMYDHAFATLTNASDPTAFRDFLLSSPDMFFRLGVNFASIQHIVSFWRYRVPKGRLVMDSAELFDLLLDFEAGVPRDEAAWRAEETFIPLETAPLRALTAPPPEGNHHTIML